MLIGGLPSVAGAQALESPYQVESVEVRRSSYEGEITLVAVSLTRAPSSDKPQVGMAPTEVEVPDFMTLLGPHGWVTATLYTVERRCEYPCTLDGGDECHWTALYSPGPGFRETGTPVAALPGQLELTEYTALADLDSPVSPVATLATDGEFVPLAWDRDPAYVQTYRVDTWSPDSGSLGLTIRQPDGNQSSIEASNCASSAREWLLRIDCDGLSLLASGGKPLLLSWPDYNSSKVEPIARFDHGGSRHYIVRFGSKAQDIVGLVSGEPAGWRARFRERNWAQLC